MDPPNEVSTISRTPDRIDIPESELAEQMRKQEFDLMRGGLLKAGIKQETLDKLGILDGLGANAGRFLVASLDMSHKMMIYSNIQLLEQADYIKKHYLEDETLEPEYKIEWQKAYNEIADLLGKGYERTLAGTQAMAKIMAGQQDEQGKAGKKKPAFSTLKSAKPVNASED